jgi:hypothetical protein
LWPKLPQPVGLRSRDSKTRWTGTFIAFAEPEVWYHRDSARIAKRRQSLGGIFEDFDLSAAECAGGGGEASDATGELAAARAFEERVRIAD